MLIEPINLTKKEKEVAQMLVNGHTRPEIAGALNISAETVKKHTNSIVRKCEASNQKEAASILYMHDFVYGEAGLDADFFLLQRDTSILIDDDRETSFLVADSVQICCKDEVSEKEGDVHCDGEIEYVEVDGQRVEALRKERGRLWYKTNFDPPIRRGQIHERNVTAKLINSFQFPNDYFFIEQPLPCKQLRLEVQFGESFKISEVEFEAKLGTHNYEPDVEKRNVGDRSIEWVIEAPKILSYFTIRWSLELL